MKIRVKIIKMKHQIELINNNNKFKKIQNQWNNQSHKEADLHQIKLIIQIKK